MPLSAVGVDDDAEDLYAVLLRTGVLQPTGLAALTGQDPEAVSAGLDQLVELGLLRRGDAEHGPLEVVDPDAALSALIDEVEERLSRDLRRASATRNEIQRYVALHREGAAAPGREEHVERIEDLTALRDRIASLSFATEHSLDAIQPGGPMSPEALETSSPLNHRALRRGVAMRGIHDIAVLDDESNRAYLVDLMRHGAEVRVSGQPLDRLLVMDRRIAVIPIDPAHSRRGALVVRASGVVAGFVTLFEQAWARAMPLTADGTPEVTEISELDRAVLLHLASGDTDESTAAHLGLSVRHLRRHIARLMASLSARSRFEAGVAAARRGWI